MAESPGLETFPFTLFKPGTEQNPDVKIWLENAQESGHGPRGLLCAPERRVYINFDRGSGYDPLGHAILDLMERDLGGHPDRHCPMDFKWICSTQDEKGSHIYHGKTYLIRVISSNGKNGTDGLDLGLNVHGYQPLRLRIFGRPFKLPISTSQKFNWSVLDDEGFERLMYRLFKKRDMEFKNVQWLQKTKAPDSGRDMSAERLENGNRVMIQARHQAASLKPSDIRAIVDDEGTWHPPFDEVIIVTSSTFTEKAIRWVERHNAKTENRPIVTLEPHGHLEVMLTKHPNLISGMGLRD